MEISDIARLTGVPAKTVRYYEEIKLLPPAERKQNGYRVYAEPDVNRLKLVAGLRRLDFSLDDIKEILDLRDRRIAPCNVLLQQLEGKAKEIHHRLDELKRLERDLKKLYSLGLTFPTDDVEGKNCVCHLVTDQVASSKYTSGHQRSD